MNAPTRQRQYSNTELIEQVQMLREEATTAKAGGHFEIYFLRMDQADRLQEKLQNL